MERMPSIPRTTEREKMLPGTVVEYCGDRAVVVEDYGSSFDVIVQGEPGLEKWYWSVDGETCKVVSVPSAKPDEAKRLRDALYNLLYDATDGPASKMVEAAEAAIAAYDARQEGKSMDLDKESREICNKCGHPRLYHGEFACIAKPYCNCGGWDASGFHVIGERLRSGESVNVELLAACKKANEFITNGIAFGYIRMPDADTLDSAHETPSIIRDAIARAESATPTESVSKAKVSSAFSMLLLDLENFDLYRNDEMQARALRAVRDAARRLGVSEEQR